MVRRKRHAAGIMALTLLALAWSGLAIPSAKAGEARAHFRAVLRIDADLVRRDLARQQGVTVATLAASASASGARSAPRTLPRAGGGLCVRRWTTRDRFRWDCR